MNYSRARNDEDEYAKFGHRLEYEVRVRGTATSSLWGSLGITQNATFQSPLVLHIRNDAHGEVINISTQVASGAPTKIGALQPGECFSIAIQNISVVLANCAAGLESTVYCVIKGN
jgi:hypothetical protein